MTKLRDILNGQMMIIEFYNYLKEKNEKILDEDINLDNMNVKLSILIEEFSERYAKNSSVTNLIGVCDNIDVLEEMNECTYALSDDIENMRYVDSFPTIIKAYAIKNNIISFIETQLIDW